MNASVRFSSDYSLSENKLSKEVKKEISLIINLSDESKFLGACEILKDLRKWELGQLIKKEMLTILADSPERRGIQNQVTYAKKLISQGLNVSIETDRRAELWVVSSASLKRRAIIQKWGGQVREIKY